LNSHPGHSYGISRLGLTELTRHVPCHSGWRPRHCAEAIDSSSGGDAWFTQVLAV